MYHFHIAIHNQPSNAKHGESVALRGDGFHPLQVTLGMPTTHLAVNFEQAEQELSHLARLFFEPDGSFVWVNDGDGPAWQVDGELYDAGQCLAYVELRGSCSELAFDALLGAFGWPKETLMFQLMRESVFLDEAAFRRYASTA